VRSPTLKVASPDLRISESIEHRLSSYVAEDCIGFYEASPRASPRELLDSLTQPNTSDTAYRLPHATNGHAVFQAYSRQRGLISHNQSQLGILQSHLRLPPKVDSMAGADFIEIPQRSQ